MPPCTGLQPDTAASSAITPTIASCQIFHPGNGPHSAWRRPSTAMRRTRGDQLCPPRRAMWLYDQSEQGNHPAADDYQRLKKSRSSETQHRGPPRPQRYPPPPHGRPPAEAYRHPRPAARCTSPAAHRRHRSSPTIVGIERPRRSHRTHRHRQRKSFSPAGRRTATDNRLRTSRHRTRDIASPHPPRARPGADRPQPRDPDAFGGSEILGSVPERR